MQEKHVWGFTRFLTMCSLQGDMTKRSSTCKDPIKGAGEADVDPYVVSLSSPTQAILWDLGIRPRPCGFLYACLMSCPWSLTYKPEVLQHMGPVLTPLLLPFPDWAVSFASSLTSQLHRVQAPQGPCWYF